jgi:hypothetical protein
VHTQLPSDALAMMPVEDLTVLIGGDRDQDAEALYRGPQGVLDMGRECVE